MKTLKLYLLVLGMLLSLNLLGQPVTKKNRLEYMKSKPIYVTLYTVKKKYLKKDDEKSKEIRKNNDLINKKLISGFERFWDLSDTIIYIDGYQRNSLIKNDKSGIFISPELYMNTILFLKVKSPDHPSLFDDIIPQSISENPTFIDIVTNLRLIRLNLLKGSFVQSTVFTETTILIPKDASKPEFKERIIMQYPELYKIVDQETIEKAILDQDPNCLYINRAGLYRAKNGQMIPIN